MNNVEQLTLRNGAEKVIFISNKKFWMEHGNLSESEAEAKAREKILKTRELIFEFSNPNSKNYFPY
jgi:hypothetical protein